MNGSEAAIVISPSSDKFAVNCTTIEILDDTFAETMETLIVELTSPVDLSYLLSDVRVRTTVNIFDDEGEVAHKAKCN